MNVLVGLTDHTICQYDKWLRHQVGDPGRIKEHEVYCNIYSTLPEHLHDESEHLSICSIYNYIIKHYYGITIYKSILIYFMIEVKIFIVNREVILIQMIILIMNLGLPRI